MPSQWEYSTEKKTVAFKNEAGYNVRVGAE